MKTQELRIERIRFEGITLRGVSGEIIFEGASLELPLNGIYLVRGESAAAKTALLKFIAGLQQPTEGRCLINESDITDMSFEEFYPFRRRIGYGFELGGLISNRTIRQNLMLPFFYHRELSAAESEERVNRYLHRFGLAAVSDLRPAQISGGLRKACCVARSLITYPELLLLDHPAAGLDQTARRTLAETIREHQEHWGLRHVYIISEDEEFLKLFDHGTIEIDSGKLRLGEAA